MNFISLLFLQVDIDKKIKEAPNGNYQTGILIGSLLPYVILVGLAYLIYYWTKKKNKE